MPERKKKIIITKALIIRIEYTAIRTAGAEIPVRVNENKLCNLPTQAGNRAMLTSQDIVEELYLQAVVGYSHPITTWPVDEPEKLISHHGRPADNQNKKCFNTN